MLLLEVARVDQQLQQQETDRLLQVLQQQWSLSEEEAQQWLDQANKELDTEVSLRLRHFMPL